MKVVRGAPVLLGAGCVAWAAVPGMHTVYSDLALLAAILGLAIAALRLGLAAIPVPEDSYLLTAATQFRLRLLRILRLVPWEEGALIAVLWLEVLHPARPWHTAVLGAALIAYLLAAHLAESGALPGVFRPHVRFLAIGAGLLALGAGAAMVSPAGPGVGSVLLRLVAAGALIAAVVLVLPHRSGLAGTPRPSQGPSQGRERLPGRFVLFKLVGSEVKKIIRREGCIDGRDRTAVRLQRLGARRPTGHRIAGAGRDSAYPARELDARLDDDPDRCPGSRFRRAGPF